MRLLVKYTDFVVGRGKVTITEIGDAPSGSEKPEPPKPGAKPNSTPQSQTPTQPSETSAEAIAPTEGGILNSKALDLPTPKYPAEARRLHEFGEVQVKVLVDETGKVISAEAVFGPESLRQAAVDAAKLARFAPRVVDGITVKVSGILTYDFKQ
jgi:periplasmic protein TonB